jgi:hypothetical protein
MQQDAQIEAQKVVTNQNVWIVALQHGQEIIEQGLFGFGGFDADV